jgi:biopolymer transport protein ExbD
MSYANESPQRAVATINITPLVDVMLVLLVIFMVAAPLLTRTIRLDLPAPGPASRAESAAPIDLRIDAAGGLTWNGAPTASAALPALLANAAQADPVHQPLLRVDANADADYEAVAKVLATARNAGMTRIGLVRRD